MPSEITHWLIARAAARELAGTALAGPLEPDGPGWHWLHLGAVFHDALFYLPPASPLARYGTLAKVMHGEAGQDSFRVLRSLVESLRRQRAGVLMAAPDSAAPPDPALTGLLIGLASHIQADSVFHPFVFFHTGLPRPDGRLSTNSAQAHYRLEALMDIHFAGGLNRLAGYRLRNHLAPIRSGLEAACAEVGRAFFQTRGPRLEFARAMGQGFDRFARVQPLFHNRLLARTLYTVRKGLPRTIREYSALAYSPQLKRTAPVLKDRHGYRHPVTGEGLDARVEELFELAVERTAELGRRLDRLVMDDRPLSRAEVGPDLSGGLPGGRATDLVHRADRRLVKV